MDKGISRSVQCCGARDKTAKTVQAATYCYMQWRVRNPSSTSWELSCPTGLGIRPVSRRKTHSWQGAL
eukprot:9412497-Pyramimonas_sp.AAC.1